MRQLKYFSVQIMTLMLFVVNISFKMQESDGTGYPNNFNQKS
jgi:hypothetical protein